MKKIVLSILIAALFTMNMPVFASAQDTKTENTNAQTEATAQPTAQPEKPAVFTIDDAVNYALENNKNIIALNEIVKANEYAIKSANQSYNSYKDKANAPSDYAPTASDVNTYYLAVGFTVESAKYDLRSAKRKVVQNEYNIKMAVQQAFYKYLNMEKKLEIAKSNLKNVNERYNQARVKNAQGTLSDLELEQFKLNVQNAQNTVNTQERDLEISMLNLKNTIGYPLEKELKINGEFTLKPIDETLPEEAVKQSFTNVSMVEIEDSFALTKYNYDLNTAWYSGNQPQYHTAKANFEAASQQHDQSVNQNTISIMTAYNTMKSAYEALDYLNNQLEITRMNVEAQKLRFDMGMITTVDYLDAVNGLAEMELAVADTSLNAYLASLSYRALYDCKDTSDTGERVENKFETKKLNK